MSQKNYSATDLETLINSGTIRLPLSHTRSLDLLARLDSHVDWNSLAHSKTAKLLKTRAAALRAAVNSRLSASRSISRDAAAECVALVCAVDSSPRKKKLIPAGPTPTNEFGACWHNKYIVSGCRDASAVVKALQHLADIVEEFARSGDVTADFENAADGVVRFRTTNAQLAARHRFQRFYLVDDGEGPHEVSESEVLPSERVEAKPEPKEQESEVPSIRISPRRKTYRITIRNKWLADGCQSMTDYAGNLRGQSDYLKTLTEIPSIFMENGPADDNLILATQDRKMAKKFGFESDEE